mmetsp:Transcript_42594/g.131539  ORF Transcript_42594/g.131539 Transcript_42594/m.131539 type:complete len:241 (-) Transcript_42594:96-818(-)
MCVERPQGPEPALQLKKRQHVVVGRRLRFPRGIGDGSRGHGGEGVCEALDGHTHVGRQFWPLVKPPHDRGKHLARGGHVALIDGRVKRLANGGAKQLVGARAGARVATAGLREDEQPVVRVVDRRLAHDKERALGRFAAGERRVRRDGAKVDTEGIAGDTRRDEHRVGVVGDPVREGGEYFRVPRADRQGDGLLQAAAGRLNRSFARDCSGPHADDAGRCKGDRSAVVRGGGGGIQVCNS